MTILNHIQNLLKDSVLSVTKMEADSDVPYERLLVVLDTPSPGKELFLEITSHPQYFEEGKFDKEKGSDSYHLIQFQYILPFECTPDTVSQVSICLHFFNRLLHFPGFELDGLNDLVVYRYVWFVKKSGIDTFLLLQVIGNIQLCYKLFSQNIQDIAEGKYSLEEILKKVVEEIDKKEFLKKNKLQNI